MIFKKINKIWQHLVIITNMRLKTMTIDIRRAKGYFHVTYYVGHELMASFHKIIMMLTSVTVESVT